MKKFKDSVVLLLLLVLVFHFATVSAGVEQVRRMNMSYFGMWYMATSPAGGSFTLNDDTYNGGFIYTYGDPSQYRVYGTITFTPTLVSDFSDTLAKGTFQGGSGVSVTVKATEIKEEGVTVFTSTAGVDDVILQGTVWGNPERTQDEWDLVESSLKAGDFEKTELYLALENTGLVPGIALDNGDVLRIGETELDLSMGDSNGNANFTTPGSAFISDPAFPSQFEFVAAIPEPATLVLLGLGGLLIRRK